MKKISLNKKQKNVKNLILIKLLIFQKMLKFKRKSKKILLLMKKYIKLENQVSKKYK